MSYWEHLSKDKKLASILTGAPLKLKKNKTVYLDLISSIMSQQLSTKVAAVIWKRFQALFDSGSPTAEQVLAADPLVLRGIGLSNAKVKYVQNVARFAIEQGMEWDKLKKMSDQEVIEYLTQIKGVGRWTSEMMLMFTLGREDVFAADDLGLQQSMARLYKLDATDKKLFREKLLKLSSRWSPYRTYACLHLWAWKDN
ncbi:DNA-3-methyladenine glycosylase family protein [Flavihumibacter petaseus]|uniref:DNA-3-methyladenine glycosylase II n=1 Tax=Flavihumibacter petaseus NBRC 106054 TaxID=1220578 RepID=A0A0E9MWY2_9BACT|nr:DNA-3-methyladenine glycosylase [Flavihumibacter petaseus]GAO42008.1 putative 3-methyladenine-DNA glycosylase [Flavihumibacter petaseus NBRC 106054]